MQTTVITSLAAGGVRDVAEALTRDLREKLASAAEGASPPARPSLVLVFASPAQPLSELLPELRERLGDVPLLAASSAGEFTERGDKHGATALFAVMGDYKVHVGMGRGLRAATRAAVAAALSSIPAQVPDYPYRTAIVMLDAIAGRSEEVTLLAAAMLGPDVRLAGGAASDDFQMKQTFVGCGVESGEDAVVVAVLFSKTPLGVGVCHGFAPFTDPLRVTRAEANVVKEIDGRPAWDVWIEKTRPRAIARGLDLSSLTREQESAFFLNYELSLNAGAELKMRVPLSRNDDGSLNFACGIPEGLVFRIADADPIESQVKAAREAARRAREQLGGRPVAGAVVFDCACRYTLLKEDFVRAIQGISDELGGASIAGFETFGEIALLAGDMSGYHNTTTVVLAFPRQ
jgi:methyl-accepting chemotaxis protein